MQTFLPLPSFRESARTLDRQRLGKQRVEAWQLLNALAGKTKGWANHPAAKMWRGHEYQLAVYGLEICREWVSRGYKDTMGMRFYEATKELPYCEAPKWITEEFCESHRSNLIRKLPAHYAPQFPKTPADLPYVWPSEK